MNKDDRKLGPLIKRIHWGIDRRFNEILKEYDLTLSQANVLRFLRINKMQGNAVTQKDIEKHLNASNPTVSGLLDRLEDKGFINRVIDPKDARRRIVVYTDKLNEFDMKMINKLDSFEEFILTDLSDDEKEELFDMLEMMIERIKVLEGGM